MDIILEDLFSSLGLSPLHYLLHLPICNALRYFVPIQTWKKISGYLRFNSLLWLNGNVVLGDILDLSGPQFLHYNIEIMIRGVVCEVHELRQKVMSHSEQSTHANPHPPPRPAREIFPSSASSLLDSVSAID